MNSVAPVDLPLTRGEIERPIGDRFEKVARAFPDRTAVRDRGRTTTYAELERTARRTGLSVADRLGETPTPVALMADAGPALFAAMLGVLRSGHFYVPLDPGLPGPRVEAILRDLEPAAIIADRSALERARAFAGGGVPVWSAEELAAGPDSREGGRRVSADDLAYVLFTSGSTGSPKGVMQTHRNVLHNARKLASGLALRPDDRLTLLSSVSFGASVSDIFGALLMGGAVCPWPLAGDGLRRLPEFLTREEITVFHAVPSVFRCFSWTLDGREDLSRLRVVRLGGETVLAADFDLYRNRFPRSCRFHTGLGATEMNVIRQWSANHDTVWPGASPLGYAVEEAEVILLDRNGGRTGPGGEGEIGVIAPTLSPGYWRDPTGTAAVFSLLPDRPGLRLYRTGDLGRMLPDGCLLHTGRTGSRLKIRGHRVETGDVESALLAVAGVREAVVEGREDPSGTRLVAWVARDPENPPRIAALREHLTKRMPGYLVPSTFVFVDALPRIASGKVDRRALPAPDASRPFVDAADREPANEAERVAGRAIASVLGLERVGADDDFFELGGDSLSAAEVVVRLSAAFGAELSIADLLEAPTAAGLSLRAGRTGLPEPNALVRIQSGERRPVFVVPGGGGDGEDLFVARRLARLTGSGFPFFSFRSGDPPHPPLAELASRCVRQLREAAPAGPYSLVGDCIGGILAVAIARRLRGDGDEVALLALLDTPFPRIGRRVLSPLARRAPRLFRLLRRSAYFLGRLRYHLGVLRALRGGRRDYLGRILRTGARGAAPAMRPREKTDATRRASYLAALLAGKPEAYAGKIHIVESEEMRARGAGAAWSRVARESETVRVPGDHAAFILDQGAQVAAALRRWLEE